MNKDIIYIDVEDDITAIIGKIKASSDKIIALVPPKRVGILQSAVNLRLLNRMAETNNKRLVLITNNKALVALSANIGIPVAKNLQSKPELPEISALDIDEGEDIIDGASLAVGDHVKLSENKDTEGDEAVEEVIDRIDIDNNSVNMKPKDQQEVGAKSKKSSRVPDFSKFRKKLFIGIASGVLLIGFLVWANVFAPAARVVVTAKTSLAVVSTRVTLGGNAETDVPKGTIKTVTQQVKKDVSIEFDVTGEKDLGNNATGTLRMSKLIQAPQTVPAGSKFTTSGGFVFITQESATIPASTPCFPSYCAQAVDVAVAAENGGTEYNGITGSASGPNGVAGTFQGATSGGTTKIAKVPTSKDIDKAKSTLQLPIEEEVRTELTAKFVNGEVIINDSFLAESSEPVSSPKVGDESANGKAKLTVSTTYTIIAIPKADIQLYLNSELEKQIANSPNQKVYDDGINSVSLTEYDKKADSATVKIVTTAKTGPSISEADIKAKVKGKIYGDAQAALESINGVVSADAKFSYFWVRTVPNDDSKISVEFKLQDAQQ